MDTRSVENLGAAYDYWQEDRAVRKDSPHTTAAQRADIEAIASRIAPDSDPWTSLHIEDLDGRTLRSAFAKYAATHAASSIARVHSTWTTFMRFCATDGLLTGPDPMLQVPKPKVPRGEPKPLKGVGVDGSTQETATRLVEFLMTSKRHGYQVWPELDRVVVLTPLLTGLRVSEVSSLNVESLAGIPGERRIGVLGKGRKHRSIPVEPPLELVLSAYQQSRALRLTVPADSDPMLVDLRGRRLTPGQLRYIVRACCRAAGVGDAIPAGAVYHALRHTWATTLAANGASAAELMRLLGHESIMTSQGYIDASVREVREAAQSNPLYGVVGEHLT